jgi:hypothetical protein
MCIDNASSRSKIDLRERNNGDSIVSGGRNTTSLNLTLAADFEPTRRTYQQAPVNTLLGFELETYQIPRGQLLPSEKVPDGVISTRKFKQIVSSINEVGLIEPLSVIQPDRKQPE